jgi:hypothetical protein
MRRSCKGGRSTHTDFLRISICINIVYKMARGAYGLPVCKKGRQSWDFLPTTLFNACEKNTMEPLPMKIVD